MERLTFSGTNPSAVKTGRPLPSPFRGILAEKIPLFLLSIASSAITMFAQRSSVDTVISMEAIPFPWRIANAFSSYAAYLGQTIWPSSLAVFYPHPKTHLALWNIGISVLLLAFISFHAVRERKRYPWLLFGWLWYLGMLVPVIGLVQVGGQARADRYTYLPLIGIFVIAAWGAKELARRYKIRSTVTAVAAGVVLTALASAAWIQTGYWKDSITLYSRALEVTEDNWAMQYNLGTELLNAGKNTEALVHLQEALKIYPGDANTNLNTGSALLGVGKTDEATRHFQRALNLRNNDYQTWMRVAGLYYRHGNTELAARCYEEVKRRFGSKIGSR
jgi:tetratricopeptide (TPR) repeat protein